MVKFTNEKENASITFSDDEKKGESNNAPVIIIKNDNCQMYAKEVSSDGTYKFYNSYIITKNNDLFDIVSGAAFHEITEMLIKAINNRTIERDYFKLYCDMLDGTIPEDDFDNIIANNENDYIVEETGIPSIGQLDLALQLSKHIKSVNSVNDLSSLFSFNPESLNSLSKNSNGKIY